MQHAPGRERTGKMALTVGAARRLSPAKALRERIASKLDDHKHDSLAQPQLVSTLKNHPSRSLDPAPERFVGK